MFAGRFGCLSVLHLTVPTLRVIVCSVSQLMSQAGGSTVDDQIALEVHSINELQSRGVAPTDDSPKYNYTADVEGNYSEYAKFKVCPYH